MAAETFKTAGLKWKGAQFLPQTAGGVSNFIIVLNNDWIIYGDYNSQVNEWAHENSFKQTVSSASKKYQSDGPASLKGDGEKFVHPRAGVNISTGYQT